MFRFVKNTIIIISITLSIVLALFFAAWFALRNVSLEIDESKNILVLGDSHTECAIDDNMDQRVKNLSVSGCPYVFSYAILKKIKEVNRQIDTVLLSFHPWSLEKSKVTHWQTGVGLESKISKYGPFVSFNDLKPLFCLDPLNFTNGYLKIPLRQSLALLKKTTGAKLSLNQLKLGGFLKLSAVLSEEFDTDKYYADLTVEGTDPTQLTFLLKIDEYCSANDIKLILISTPLYDWQPNNLGNSFKKAQKEYLSHIDFMDFSQLDCLGRDCFKDIDHLNKKGAAVFTEFLLNEI